MPAHPDPHLPGAAAAAADTDDEGRERNRRLSSLPRLVPSCSGRGNPPFAWFSASHSCTAERRGSPCIALPIYCDPLPRPTSPLILRNYNYTGSLVAIHHTFVARATSPLDAMSPMAHSGHLWLISLLLVAGRWAALCEAAAIPRGAGSTSKAIDVTQNPDSFIILQPPWRRANAVAKLGETRALASTRS
ncbi:unnamed protein product [Parajaminaea phylloscopi]